MSSTKSLYHIASALIPSDERLERLHPWVSLAGDAWQVAGLLPPGELCGSPIPALPSLPGLLGSWGLHPCLTSRNCPETDGCLLIPMFSSGAFLPLFPYNFKGRCIFEASENLIRKRQIQSKPERSHAGSHFTWGMPDTCLGQMKSL